MSSNRKGGGKKGYVSAGDFAPDISAKVAIEKSIHDVSLTSKNPKGGKAYTEPRPQYFKKNDGIVIAAREVCIGEINRALAARNPKTKIAIDGNDVHVLSQRIAGFKTIRELIAEHGGGGSGAAAVVAKINDGTYKGLGQIMMLALMAGESDLHIGNIGINNKGEFCKIDGDWSCARLRYAEGSYQDQSIRKFYITEDVLTRIPMINTSEFFPYNWFDQVECGTVSASASMLGQLDTKILRDEVNHQLLKMIVMPYEYYQAIVNHHTDDQVEANTTLLEIMNNREQLMAAAFNNPEFRQFVQDHAKEVEIEMQSELSNFRLSGKVPLDDLDAMKKTLSDRFEFLSDVMAQNDYSAKVDTHLQKFSDIDVKLKNKNGETPLLLAASNGNLQVFENHAIKVANMSERDNYGMDALQIAFHENRYAFLDKLFQFYPELKADLPLSGLLHDAVDANQAARVAWLLKNDADLNEIDSSGNSPLLNAVRADNTKICKLLLANPDIDLHLTNDDGDNAFQIAARNGSYEICELLYKKGQDPCAVISQADGQTILHISAVENRTECLEYFMDHDLSMKTKDVLGQTPLMLAVLHGSTEFAGMLLGDPVRCGLNDVDLSGSTALMCAVIANNANMVDELMAAGANPNIADQFGKTPAHYASEIGNNDVINALNEGVKNRAESVDKPQGSMREIAVKLAASTGVTSKEVLSAKPASQESLASLSPLASSDQKVESQASAVSDNLSTKSTLSPGKR